ncbi:hypothetical protein SUGI_1196500 [Cryptomeria japonica]|nr:hypothetical protein SUGI_1196500 [Cryptomeria japonica]
MDTCLSIPPISHIFWRFTRSCGDRFLRHRAAELASKKLCEDLTCVGQDEVEVLSTEFADKTAKVFFHSNWIFPAYKEKLQSCIEPLIFYRIEMDSTRSIKLIIRISAGASFWTRDFLRPARTLPVKDLKSLHLQTLGYQRASSRRKISIIVADLRSRQLQFNVSARAEGNEAFDEKILITRVRNQPKRHGFVTFCREGSATTDFRLGVMTHGTDLHPDKEMVEWIEEAWRNRTPTGCLSLSRREDFSS